MLRESGGRCQRLLTALLAALVALMAPSAVPAEEASSTMTTYQFAFLMDGPRRGLLQGEEAAATQRAHLAFLRRLVEEGQALVVGPLEDAAPLRGIVVLQVDSVQEASTILSGDPWVQAGHLATRIHSWWAAQGILQPVFDSRDLQTCWLGLLRRPEDAPSFDQEQLQTLQAGHMDNIKAMAASGDLVIAGPIAEDGPLRGLFIFRTESRQAVRQMVDRDPAIQAGRLEVELIRWSVPRGAMPAKR